MRATVGGLIGDFSGRALSSHGTGNLLLSIFFIGSWSEASLWGEIIEGGLDLMVAGGATVRRESKNWEVSKKSVSLKKETKMKKFIITPEEIKIIKSLREYAQTSEMSITEWLDQIMEWAYESNLDKTLSNWSVGKKGQIIKKK